MALQAFSKVAIGELLTNSNDATTYLVDASGEKAALVVQAPATGQLWKIGFRTGTVVQTQTIKASFQSVDPATGFPTETADQFRTLSVADTDDNVWKLTGIISSDGTDSGTLRSVTRGEDVAIVLEHNSFTTGDVFRVFGMGSGTNQSATNCYGLLKTGGTWAKQGSMRPSIVLLYSDGSCYHIPGAPGVTAITGTTIASNSAPPKRGLKFKIPFSATLSNVQLLANCQNADSDFDVKLYADTDATTPIATCQMRQGAILRGVNGIYWQDVYFATDQTIAANTWYYITIEPTSTNGITYYYLDVDQASYLDQCAGGQNFHHVQIASGVATATTTRRPFINLFLNAIDDGTGGGSGAMILSRVRTGM
jgi:hypothetical protein